MAFNENTRVKIPAILHLRRLGYQYISLLNAKRDENTNIFTGLFSESLIRINKDIDTGEIKKTLENISLALDNEDLGKTFFEMLTSSSGIKLIDFSTPENFAKNNSFHVVTE
jgi:type I restriction enzyme R subunit